MKTTVLAGFFSVLLLFSTAHAESLTAPLKPGEFRWHPERAPSGPVLLAVTIPQQKAYVYRNGVLIGYSTVSTGQRGHETPTGAFQVLQKKREHTSNIYKGAKMPNMQRLTWTGIALHAGNLPGYPASHGCIRLPLEFSRLLFGVTSLGITVVITGQDQSPQTREVVDQLSSRDELAHGEYWWEPERSTKGPVSVVASLADGRVYVQRNGVRIASSAIHVDDRARRLQGTAAFVRLDRNRAEPSRFVPGKPAAEWQEVGASTGKMKSPPDLAGHVQIPVEFATKVYDLLSPGTVMVITSESSTQSTRTSPGFVIMKPQV